MTLYPLKLTPAFKDYIWGGTRLKTEYKKETPLHIVAESWELSTHKDGESTVSNGSLASLTLSAAIEKMGRECLGTNAQGFDRFPILIKLIDAKRKLSVQVHPDDEYAQRVEGEPGKTEMWYIVDAEKGASLVYGLKKKVTKQEFKDAAGNGTLMDMLESVPVKKGDVFFIPSGTVHAIGEGILIAEIQQNSNTTYRVYDYGRLGADGKPRQLHIDKAVEVSTLEPAAARDKVYAAERKNGYTETKLAGCRYFNVSRLDIDSSAALQADDKSFLSLLFLDGVGEIISDGGKIPFAKGDSIFIPAGMGDFTVSGTSQAILSKV